MKRENNTNLEIVNGSVLKVFLKFTIPNVIGFMAMSSSAIVDGIFVGKYVGETALAAINIVIPIMTLVYGIAIMLSIGGAVRVGKYLGEHNFRQASATFTNIHITIAAIALSMSFICIFFSGTVVKLLGANAEIAPYSIIYLRTMGIFFIVQAFEYSFSVFVRVDEDPYLASAAVILGAGINLALDYLFIVVMEKGIWGAAFGTGISYTVSSLILVFHFLLKRGNLRFLFKKYDRKEILSSAYNGSSEFLSEASSGVVAFLFNWVMITKLGTKGVAAFTVINYAIWTMNMLCYSIGDSLVPLMSVNYGARNKARIAKFLKIGLFSVIMVGFTVFLIMALIPEKLVGLFLNPSTREGKEAFEIAVVFAAYIKWAFLFSGSSIIISAYFTSIHKPLQSVIIAGSRGLWFPVIFLGTLPLIVGPYGIYIAEPLAELVTVIIAIFLYFRFKGRESKLNPLNARA